MGLIAPFTTIDALFNLAFRIGLTQALQRIEGLVTPPLLACVTLWIIVQGVLVMRGDLETRRGIAKVIMVALVVGLVTGADQYQTFVGDFFQTTIPAFVQQIGDFGGGAPVTTIPTQLDGVFVASEALFQKVGAQIPPDNEQDTMAFDGAHAFLFATLWIAFGIYDTTAILTAVLVAIGPLVLIGYLFEATRPMATRWIGQLATYALLLLLLSLVATIVVATEFSGLAAQSAAILAGGPATAKVVGLYELDMFFLTGDALIVALPTIAGSIAGGVTTPDNGLWPARILKVLRVNR